MVTVKDITDKVEGKGKDGKIIKTGDLAWYQASSKHYCVVVDSQYGGGRGLTGYFSGRRPVLEWDKWGYFTQIGPMMGLWDD